AGTGRSRADKPYSKPETSVAASAAPTSTIITSAYPRGPLPKARERAGDRGRSDSLAPVQAPRRRHRRPVPIHLQGLHRRGSAMTSPPRHSVSVAAAVIDPEGRALVIRRRDNHHWQLPGGILELGESIHDGLRREIGRAS